jgi:hypothetical protein
LCPELSARPQPLAHALKFTLISAVEEQVKGVSKVYFETQENKSLKVSSCNSLCASIGVITLSDKNQLPLLAFLLIILTLFEDPDVLGCNVLSAGLCF